MTELTNFIRFNEDGTLSGNIAALDFDINITGEALGKNEEDGPVYRLFGYAQQSLGDLFENFRSTSLGPAADFIGAAAFFGGIVLVLLAIFKLIQNSRNPHDTGSRPITALVMFIAGSLCIALPEFAGVGVTSFLGSGAETSTVDGTLRSIN